MNPGWSLTLKPMACTTRQRKSFALLFMTSTNNRLLVMGLIALLMLLLIWQPLMYSLVTMWFFMTFLFCKSCIHLSAKHASLTRSFAPDWSGPKKSWRILTMNNIRRFPRRTVDPHHLRPGDGAWPITRSRSKTSPNFLRRCWTTVSRTLWSPVAFGNSSSNKTIQSHRSGLSTTLLLPLTNKLEQVFLLMLMHALISWMVLEQNRKNWNLIWRNSFRPLSTKRSLCPRSTTPNVVMSKDNLSPKSATKSSIQDLVIRLLIDSALSTDGNHRALLKKEIQLLMMKY